MKKLIVLSAVLFLISFADKAFGQKQRTQTITIKTSAECDICKKKVETVLASEKGIKKTMVDLDAREVIVTYDSKKISPEKIRSVISNCGYDADSIPANNKAYQQIKQNHK